MYMKLNLYCRVTLRTIGSFMISMGLISLTVDTIGKVDLGMLFNRLLPDLLHWDHGHLAL